MGFSDQVLLKRYLKGDRGAFDVLYRRFAPRVHATAYRMTGNWEDAEEILQDVFLRLARKARQLKQVGSLGTWIYRTTINCSIDLLRKRRFMVSVDSSEGFAVKTISVASVRNDALRAERRERESLLCRIEDLIPRLPERQAAVFVLKGFQGLTHRQIASVLGCNEGTSKSHYSTACRRIRLWIARSEKEEEAEGGERRVSCD